LLFRCYVKFICIFKLFPQLTTSVRAAYAGRTQQLALSRGYGARLTGKCIFKRQTTRQLRS
jgi:hypothetical protein